ncbi:MAG: hypothetical protein KDA92_18130 [Planctomycetales bacterium]|nr:hypothetical protein [Planctomycetales bacterium]
MTIRDLFSPLASSRTLGRVGLYALGVGAYAALPVWKEKSAYRDFADLDPSFHAVLAVLLGWLLVFRINTAYGRWWEARTLWGSLVNTSRILAAKIAHLVRLTPALQDECQRLIIAFPYALRDHLRDESCVSRLPGFADCTDEADHLPGLIVSKLYEVLYQAKSHQLVDGDELRVIDEELRNSLLVCGGCERIYRTRMIRSYKLFARQCIALFLVTYPWAVCHQFGAWTIPLTTVVSYFMIGLETVAEHVEEPFGRDDDDLDLDGLCTTIERTVQQIMAAPHQVV